MPLCGHCLIDNDACGHVDNVAFTPATSGLDGIELAAGPRRYVRRRARFERCYRKRIYYER